MTLKAKLLKIQMELNAPKDQYNDFGKFNYRSCESILVALKPLCEKQNLVLHFTDDVVNIGDRNYVKATAILTDVDSDEVISNTAFAREDETKKGMDGSQITGSSSSYARKYALNGLFAIDDNKDADYAPPAGPPTKEQLEQAKALGIDMAKLAIYNKCDEKQLTKEQVANAIEMKRKAQANKKEA